MQSPVISAIILFYSTSIDLGRESGVQGSANDTFPQALMHLQVYYRHSIAAKAIYRHMLAKLERRKNAFFLLQRVILLKSFECYH